MTMFTYYEKAIKDNAKKHYNEVIAAIKGTTATNFDYLHSRGYITLLRYNQLRNNELDIAKAQEIALKSYTKSHLKELQEELDLMQSRISSPLSVQSMTINIRWVRNATWGYNPKVDATVRFSDGTFATYEGTASGCGYDKRSAAVASALNKCNVLLGEMAKLKYKNRNRTANGHGNEAYIAYGAGYGILPYLEGGVGFSCHETIFKLLGFKENVNVYDSKAGYESYTFVK